jgi:hypothetical protein
MPKVNRFDEDGRELMLCVSMWDSRETWEPRERYIEGHATVVRAIASDTHKSIRNVMYGNESRGLDYFKVKTYTRESNQDRQHCEYGYYEPRKVTLFQARQMVKWLLKLEKADYAIRRWELEYGEYVCRIAKTLGMESILVKDFGLITSNYDQSDSSYKLYDLEEGPYAINNLRRAALAEMNRLKGMGL